MTAHLELIDDAIERHGNDKTEVFALVSGGNDSMATLVEAMKHPRFTAAVHINTGVGVPATSEYVRDTCRDLRCPLIELCAKDNTKADGTPDPQIYEQLVLEHGFPGPSRFGHGKMYNRLKERQLERLQRERGATFQNPLVFVTGVRSKESARRMGHVQPIQYGRDSKRRVWTAIIHDWDKDDCRAAMQAAGVQPNPVAVALCRSGECNCGAFGHLGELEEMAAFDLSRQHGEYLLDLQKRVYAEMKRKWGVGWLWHEGPPDWLVRERKDLKRGQRFLPGVLCHDCKDQGHA